MMRSLVMGSLMFSLTVSSSANAYTFPGFGKPLPPPPDEAPLNSDYDFAGIVSLSGCSGSLVRFDDSDDHDKALVLTNGHCVRMIAPGVVIIEQASNRSFDILSPAGRKIGTVRASSLVYATMTKTDLALYRLTESYEEIRKKFQTEALLMARDFPEVGMPIEIISGYWKRGYRCDVEAYTPFLKEAEWLFEDSIRYSRPGCEVIGGTSGSPVIEMGTRTVVAVNNTINERGARCTMNNPCEIDELGNVLFQRGFGYAQQTAWVYSCRDDNGAIDLAIEGCLLPKPTH